ncbi:uncharacterized protein LOC119379579 [Rhipicephalus sanguineus]|uniref:Exonuclease domain-containing protein n=1 Tax=Rhipicephalus sanguineus TaxID=34632 RepID=A0A9D4YNJ0_RHISA|nr:uncharacterized protein LOC119378590 [Rhipicephalus sanguineus]XP_037504812.1 uncharacterized protein LOC119379579 [Rhipicephalus sanguineus]KAH7983114.1 hypothetical protein HPB52_009281 [Rhipicephalus sanguineus]KAH7987755.1 hypothetical protein HPB52_025620 [Rhipicephalus sanguineus]
MDKPSGKQRQIETLVFLDLESTGLPDLMPRRKVNVTELSLIAVPRKLLRNPLRCLHRLSFCVQPRNAVTVDAADITGLDNWDLQWCPSFGEMAQVMEKFLYTLQPPICLVAHNGDKFDFPLLRAELKHAAPGIDLTAFFCCDSLPAFREILGDAADPQEVTEVIALGEVGNDFWEAFEAADITSASDSDEHLPSQPVERPTHQTPPNKASASDGIPPPVKKRRGAREENGQRPQQCKLVARRLFQDAAPANGSNTSSTSAVKKPVANGKKVQFKLGKVYERVMGTEMPLAHEAEADCRALAEICARLGSRFLEYVDAKHHMLQNVTPMWE